MTQLQKIAIVGGGLAGLAAANALAKFHFEFEIFEQARTLSEIGAGISISSQAVKALEAIGVGEKLAAIGNVSHGVLTRNMQTGEPLDFRMKHMSDRTVQKALFAKAGHADSMGWIWEYDPIESWDKTPTVPAIE
jgi:2-polyprenyl-6-methoxyphenol hydroxylase-like FAD-dependent oxidoreductase